MYREKIYQLHTTQRQLPQPQNNLEKMNPSRNRDNLQYKKTADLAEPVHEN